MNIYFNEEIKSVPQTREGLVGYMLSVWSSYNGRAISYDPLYRISKMNDLAASYNHKLAVSPSSPNRESKLKKLLLPTLIIHAVDLILFFSRTCLYSSKSNHHLFAPAG